MGRFSEKFSKLDIYLIILNNSINEALFLANFSVIFRFYSAFIPLPFRFYSAFIPLLFRFIFDAVITIFSSAGKTRRAGLGGDLQALSDTI